MGIGLEKKSTSEVSISSEVDTYSKYLYCVLDYQLLAAVPIISM